MESIETSPAVNTPGAENGESFFTITVEQFGEPITLRGETAELFELAACYRTAGIKWLWSLRQIRSFADRLLAGLKAARVEFTMIGPDHVAINGPIKIVDSGYSDDLDVDFQIIPVAH